MKFIDLKYENIIKVERIKVFEGKSVKGDEHSVVQLFLDYILKDRLITDVVNEGLPIIKLVELPDWRGDYIKSIIEFRFIKN